MNQLSSNVKRFNQFLHAYPAEKPSSNVDAAKLSSSIKKTLGVEVPDALNAFWQELGSGYFGKKDLYFFGDESSKSPRDTFISWNQKNFWKEIYPSPKDGGPVFFAETCFGDQIGFRWENGNCICILFSIDTFDAFVIANNFDELFLDVLIDRYAVVEPEHLDKVFETLGELQPGMHYAPKISPMLGGTGGANNFCIENPNIHFRTALATFKAVQSLPPGASVTDVEINWSE